MAYRGIPLRAYLCVDVQCLRAFGDSAVQAVQQRYQRTVVAVLGSAREIVQQFFGLRFLAARITHEVEGGGWRVEGANGREHNW